MNETLQKRCELFIHNRDVLRKLDPLDTGGVHAVAAGMLTASNVTADAAQLKACRKILEQRTGVFSNFRGFARLPVICTLFLAKDPERMTDRASACYQELKKVFSSSAMLPLTAMILAGLVPEGDASAHISRGHALYKRMKEKHPLLTGSEDTPLAVLLAFSEKSDDVLINEMELVYAELKPEGLSSNGVQSISQIFALTPGDAMEKCTRFRKLLDELKARGSKYSKSFGLGALAAMAALPVRTETLTEELIAVEEWLTGQKGYGFFGFGAKDRRIHAAMILNGYHTESAPGASSEDGVRPDKLSLLAEQSVLICSAITICIATSSAYHVYS